jgi:hypothetical protein
VYAIDHSYSDDIFDGITEDEERMNALVDNECLASVVTPQLEDESFYWYVDSQLWLYSLYQVAEVGAAVYDFSEFNLADYTKTGTWNTSGDSIYSSWGLLFIPNNNEEYTITTSAKLNEGDGGGYGILFETSLNSENKDTGYVLQFDRGLNAIVIRPRTESSEKSTIVAVNHSDNALIPDSKNDDWWSETHDVKLQVTKVDGTDDKKAVTVWIDGTEVLTSFQVDAATNAENNFTGLRSWTTGTSYNGLTIE